MSRHSPRVWSAALACALVSGSLACSDSSAPAPRTEVALNAQVVSGPEVGIGNQYEPWVECVVSLQASATGTGAVLWEDATMAFHIPGSATTPGDTIQIATHEVADIWNATQIEAGELQHTEERFRAGAPFGVTLAFRYRASRDSRPRVAETSFNCGPTLPATSSPPVISDLAVEPASGVIDPGQPFMVKFTAESPVGIVQSRIELKSACMGWAVNPEPLATTLTRTVSIKPDFVCRTDTPLTVAVTVFDALGVEATRTTSMTITLEDRTPPTIAPVFQTAHPSSTHPDHALELFTSGAFNVDFKARDNYRLAWLVWEALPSGVRDSIAVTEATLPDRVRIPVRAEWGTGPIRIRVQARDAAGLASDPYTTAPNAMVIYPTQALESRAAHIAGEVHDVAIDTRRRVVYLRQHAQRRITAMSLETMAITRTIDLPAPPDDFDLTPNGDSLLVSLRESRALGVVDLRDPMSQVTLVPLTILDASVQQVPGQLRYAANGRVLLALHGVGPAATRIAEIDLVTGSQRVRADWPEASKYAVLALERSGDGSAIVIQGGENQFQRYDVATDAFGPRRSARWFSSRPSVDATGRRVAIGLDVYDEALLPLRTVRSTNFSGLPPSALSSDGEYLYTLMGDDIVRSRVSDGAIVDNIPNPVRFPDLLRVSADGAWLVTAQRWGGTLSNVSVIRLR